MRSLSLLIGSVILAACSSSSVEREEAGHPDGAIFRYFQRLDERGRIPDDAIVTALAQRQASLASPSLPGGGIAVTGTAGPQGWTWLGPGNIGGRIRSILIHPTQPNTMWLGAVSGGIWKTTDGGASWSPLNDFLASLTIGCMAIDPANPNLLYAGTGEGFFNTVQGSSNTAAIQGAGIFASSDGGTTWSHLPSTSGAAWNFVNRIAIQPGNSQVFLAATGGGIFRSTDGGASWSQRTTTRTLDLDFHPTDGMKAVAGRNNGIAQYSADGGLSWLTATGITGATRIEVAYAKSSPATVYAAVTAATGGIKIWRSIDGGASYALQTSGTGVSNLSIYTSALWVDPTNPNLLVFGGVNLYRSTNAGVTYSSVSSGIHPDHHVLAEHPAFNGTTNRTLFEGNDGGIYRTTDIAASSVSWLELNNTLGITQFYGAAMNPTTGILIGGTQDNGTKRYGGGTETWTTTFGGDGGFCAADPTDPNYFYGETQYLNIFRSTNGGISASYIDSGINDPTPNFIPYFILDPNNPNRMLAAGAQLWRSNNVKAAVPAWSSIKPALTCASVGGGGPSQSHFQDNPPCNVSTIAVAQGNSDVVWVGHNNGEVYKTTNGTAVSPLWVKVDDNPPGLPARWCSRIAIDPLDPNRVVASFMGYAPDSVWRTLDGGASWTPIVGSGPSALPSVPVSCILKHEVLPGRLYAGTDFGLYFSEDDGATWGTTNDGPGLAPVDEVFWKDDRTIVAVTHGRGVYTGDTSVPGSATVAGSGCGAGPPALSATPPTIGTALTFTLAGGSPNSPVVLAVGYGPPVPTDLGNGCVAQGNLAISILFGAGSTDGLGNWTYGLPLPYSGLLVGGVATAQTVGLVSGGPLLGIGELSNGLQVQIGF